MSTDRTNNPGRALEPFVWHSKGIEDFPHIRTLDTIKSLAGGVSAVLEIIEADELNDGDADTFGRVLSVGQVSALMRLAIAVSTTIEAECETAMEWAAEHGANRIKGMAEQMERTT